MKNFIYLVILLTLSLSFASCGGSNGESDDVGDIEPTALEAASIDLTGQNGTTVTTGSKAWSLGTIKKDGTDVTSDFIGFTLTLAANKQWNTSSGGAVWASGGTYSLTENTLTIGSTNISFTSDGNSLTLNFTIANSTAVGAKPEVVDGTWEFSLVP